MLSDFAMTLDLVHGMWRPSSCHSMGFGICFSKLLRLFTKGRSLAYRTGRRIGNGDSNRRDRAAGVECTEGGMSPLCVARGTWMRGEVQ